MSRVLKLIENRYESADLTTPLRDWGNTAWERMLSEDTQFTSEIRAVVLTRFRWEVRNNPLLAGLVSKFASSLGSPTLRTRTSDRSYNAKADSAFFAWAKRMTVGSDDADSHAAVSEQIWNELCLAGELFIVFLANGRVQLVPSEFCGSPSDKLPAGEKNGIGRNPDNSVKYYRFTKSSDSQRPDYAIDKSEVVDAKYVVHLFKKDRVAMGRGLPWLLSSLPVAHDLIEIIRSKTKQIKDASSLCGVIESENYADAVRDMARTEGMQEIPGVEVIKSPNPPQVDLAPGTFVPLRAGEKMNVLSSKYEADDYEKLVSLMLCMVSAPIGLPVEIWFSGMGEVNFSGSKALGVQWADRRRDYLRFMEEKFLNRLHFWRVSRLRLLGVLPQNPDGDDDLIKWTWKAAATLDPERDARANETRLRTGQASLADIWEEQDLFYEEVLTHRKQLWDTARQIAGLPAAPAPIEWMLGAQSLPATAATTATPTPSTDAN